MALVKKLLWGMLLIYGVTVDAATFINKIKYKGNEVTQASVFNREIYIREGEEIDIKRVEKSRQAIMDLDLFKTVYFYLEENDQADNNAEDHFVNIVFVVKEKHYLIVLPRLKVEEDVFYYGIQLRWDNVFGLRHKARILVQDRGETQGVAEKRNRFKYFYSNVNGSNYNLSFLVEEINAVDESNEELIDRQDENYSISIKKWLNKSGRSRGGFAGGSVLYQKRLNEDLIVSENSENIDALVLGVDIGYRNLNTYEYNRGGKAYGYKLEWAHQSIGSDSEFTKHLFYYRSYYRFKSQPLSNLNVQMKVGSANNLVLGKDAFSLGSSSDLRGYENNRFSGNSLFLTNIEYMFPHSKYPVIRYVSFIDMGNTYDDLSDMFHSPLNVGAGVGLRWKIRGFVKLDIRVDVGYGFTDEDYRFSFGSKHAF